MESTKIATSMEQSKLLGELGLDLTTADMYYSRVDQYSMNPVPKVRKFAYVGDSILAWSIIKLLKLIETYTMQTDQVGKTFITCEKASHITNSYDEPIDAVVELVIWLIENKII